MKAANPYLTFNGQTEDAFAFYQSVFGGEFLSVVRFRDMDMPDKEKMSEEALNRIAHIALPLGPDAILMASDSLESMGPPLTSGNNFSISIEAEREEEGQRLMDALSDGGEVTMPYEKTEWAEKFGMCVDKFGVQWMVDYTTDEQS